VEVVIDLHCHILPGIDDGVRTLDEALELAYAASRHGVEAIAATPHVRADYPTSPEQMERLVGVVRAELERREVPMRLLAGAEVDVAALWELQPEDLRRFTLAQTGRYLLIESPYRGWRALETAVPLLLRRGITPIVAHPERTAEVQDQPARVERLAEQGALVQVTVSSLEGRANRAAEAAARRLLDLGIVHCVASDSHGPHIRRGGLGGAAALIGDGALARYLTTDAPAAIAAGEDVPQPPA
jgi:protein-tyrosine phosphatase